METEPKPAGNAHWVEPERQRPTVDVLKRMELRELTPVFSSALPPKGLSGLLRRAAYEVPEHRATHWALLLLGDRVDVLEHRLRRALPVFLPLLTVGLLTAALARPRFRRRRRR
jgi:hypothetical protein